MPVVSVFGGALWSGFYLVAWVECVSIMGLLGSCSEGIAEAILRGAEGDGS